MSLFVAALAALQLSSNWSGYVASTPPGAPAPLTFTQATGSWRVPRVACTRRGTSAAFWVGIGGSTPAAPALGQLGAAADCQPDGAGPDRAGAGIIPHPPNLLPPKGGPGDL